MEQLIINFPNQLREAMEIAANASVTAPTRPIRNIVLAGLGGSGIGGNLVAELIRDECKVPFLISKGYSLPKFINKNTLVILSSYSGNTEETLAACAQAIAAECKIIAISAGGKLIELAKQHGFDHIIVPGGMPPRSCLGYSVVQQVAALHKYGIVRQKMMKDLGNIADFLQKEQANIQKLSKKVAAQLLDKIAVIYTTDRMESVAVRFRQQVNENSKMLCWHHVIPEMNHNELVGWRDESPNLAVVLFRNADDHPRNAARIDINKTTFGAYTPTTVELWSKGRNQMQRAFYFIHLGDFITTDLAILRPHIDPSEVKVIDHLKGELAKLG
jgi:glucose/mannose-6-phosphate isomerase